MATKKSKSKAQLTPEEEVQVPDEPGKAVTVTTMVTKFKEEKPAPAAVRGQVAPDEEDDDETRDPEDPGGGDDWSETDEILSEADAILNGIEEGEVTMLRVDRLPTFSRNGQTGNKAVRAYCGEIELTRNYLATIQTVWGGGSYWLTVRWPSGQVRKQWTVHVEPPRVLPNESNSAAAGQIAPAPIAQPLVAQPEALGLKEQLATVKGLLADLKELGLIPTPAAAPAQSNPQPATPEQYFLQFAMTDEDTRRAIVRKYLGDGVVSSSDDGSMTEVLKEVGKELVRAIPLDQVFAYLASRQQQQPAQQPPQAPQRQASAEAPAPAPPQTAQQHPAPPAQRTVQDAMLDYLVNSIATNNPIEDVVKAIHQVEVKHPQLVPYVTMFINTPAETVLHLLGERYPQASERLQRTETAEYILALQDALETKEGEEGDPHGA